MKTCIYCNGPLIMTMIFKSAELYCWPCRMGFPMHRCNESPETPERKARKKQYKLRFFQAAKHYIPEGKQMVGCMPCMLDRSSTHRDHWTIGEIERHEKAVKLLFVKPSIVDSNPGVTDNAAAIVRCDNQ